MQTDLKASAINPSTTFPEQRLSPVCPQQPCVPAVPRCLTGAVPCPLSPGLPGPGCRARSGSGSAAAVGAAMETRAPVGSGHGSAHGTAGRPGRNRPRSAAGPGDTFLSSEPRAPSPVRPGLGCGAGRRPVPRAGLAEVPGRCGRESPPERRKTAPGVRGLPALLGSLCSLFHSPLFHT